MKYHRIWFRPQKILNSEELPRGADPEQMQPFVIGYFKEEIYEEDPIEDDRTVNGNSKVYINPRDLFTKDFLKMKTPGL